MADAGDGITIKVVNNTTTFSDNTPIPLQIVAAGPTARNTTTGSGGSKSHAGGTLTPQTLPITVAANGSQSFSASSSSGSGGWVNGAITIACNYQQLPTDAPAWQNLQVNYTGEPATVKHGDLCTASCTGSAKSSNFTVLGVAQSGKNGGCVITFTATNGGTSPS